MRGTSALVKEVEDCVSGRVCWNASTNSIAVSPAVAVDAKRNAAAMVVAIRIDSLTERSLAGGSKEHVVEISLVANARRGVGLDIGPHEEYHRGSGGQY